MRNFYAISLLFVLLCTNAFSQTPYYTVKFPDDITIYSCGVVPVSSYPTITSTGNCNFNVGVNQHDQVFYTGGGNTCAKILRTWTLIWWCDYDPNTSVPTYIMNPGSSDTGPTVQGNAANHGYLKYTQVIKILDNVPPVFLNCPSGPVTFCDLTENNPGQYNQWGHDRCEGPVDLSVQVTDACAKANVALSYRLFLDLDGNGSMETFISSSSPGAWPIETSVSGNVLTGKIKFPNNYGLPYGTHKIEWIASDNCAGQAICKYDFIVKDCKAPTLVCLNGLSVNIMPTGMITLWASDFLHYAFDNCTPANQLKISIRKAGTGTGFPTNIDGTPVTGVTFTCAELGTNSLELWAQDAFGNADFCTTYVIIQDHIGACPPPPSIPNGMKGLVATSKNKNIAGVDVQAKNLTQAMLCETDTAGVYTLSNMATCDLTLTPTHNVNVNQGVTLHDLTLLAYHYAGLDTITDPYVLLAADVNRDGQITDMDLSGILGVALGIDSAFVNNTSWRFVPKSFVFPDSLSALSVSVPDKINLLTPACLQPKGDFVGIKVGDINHSALNPLADLAENTSQSLFSINDLDFETGEIVNIAVECPELDNLSDFQFQLAVSSKTLRLLGVEPGLVPSNQIHFDSENGKIKAGWSAAINAQKAKKGAAFTLICQALRPGNSSASIVLENGDMPAEAYLSQGAKQSVALTGSANAAAGALRIMPITPNPTNGLVNIQFEMPEAATATLSLRSATGLMLHSQTGEFVKGLNNISLDLSRQGVSGLVFVRLECSKGTSTQQLMLER
jgi:hypothetical protein